MSSGKNEKGGTGDDDDSSDSMDDGDTPIYQNEITADTIKRVPSNIQPMLTILNIACAQVSRARGDIELRLAVLAFMEKFPLVTADNFYGSKDIVTAISDARCFFMILKQLPPFPSHKVSTAK